MDDFYFFRLFHKVSGYIPYLLEKEKVPQMTSKLSNIYMLCNSNDLLFH